MSKKIDIRLIFFIYMNNLETKNKKNTLNIKKNKNIKNKIKKN